MQNNVCKCIKCEHFNTETNNKNWKIHKCELCKTKCWLGGYGEEPFIEGCSDFKAKENK